MSDVSSQMVTSSVQRDGDAVIPAAVATALCAQLPAGAAVALAWSDPVLGEGRHGHPEGGAAGPVPNAPRQQAASARLALQQCWHHGGSELTLDVSLAGDTPPPDSWWTAARCLFQSTVLLARQRREIASLEDSKRLQQALYEIADLAGADLEMAEMLRHFHRVLNSLMYAQNCFIVEYDDVRHRVRFLYFADQKDDFVADPDRSYEEHEMPRSLTFALLRHGEPLSGPSRELLAILDDEHDPERGPESLDWLGVPMLRDGRVCGAIVVQSYEHRARYGEADRTLLGYVAQHILTAMDRRQAQVQLERQVERRTVELQRANRNL
ncbi:MAG: GAF domain-containing protein, partial [Stenotrophomonas bentonitica]